MGISHQLAYLSYDNGLELTLVKVFLIKKRKEKRKKKKNYKLSGGPKPKGPEQNKNILNQLPINTVDLYDPHA